jgi:leader peptidase (prepilin peptidase)/N-methyltransferase
VPLGYVVGELTLGALFSASYLTLGLTSALIALLAVLTILMFIVLYDLRHTVVPRTASWLLLVSAGAYAIFEYGAGKELGASLLSAGFVSLFFFLLYAFSRGRAMGLGDAPVALALALVVGSTHAVAGLLFSFWIGAVVGIVILAMTPRGHRMGIEVPFVPFLAAGYLLAFFTQWNPLPLF